MVSFVIYDPFLVFFFIFTNNGDPGEMPYFVLSHLDLNCLSGNRLKTLSLEIIDVIKCNKHFQDSTHHTAIKQVDLRLFALSNFVAFFIFFHKLTRKDVYPSAFD